jgi:DNA-directed RNA polymerase specialized sigma24 family protein
MTDALGPALRAAPPPFETLLRPPEYGKLRERLIRIFARRGCEIPQDLADETISRVLGRLPQISESYVGDPLLFILAVARNVYREYARRPRMVPFDDRDRQPDLRGDEVSRRERMSDCLESCLEELEPKDRRLIREYYRHDEASKIDQRRVLAKEMGLGINALWIRAFRIRQRLAGCVLDCSKKNGANLK